MTKWEKNMESALHECEGYLRRAADVARKRLADMGDSSDDDFVFAEVRSDAQYALEDTQRLLSAVEAALEEPIA